MQQELVEVLLLQTDFSAENTPEMNRRGTLIRHTLPDQIRSVTATSGLTTLADLQVQGKDGTGLKTEIPWIRLHSAARSRRPTDGWYVVYLFSAEGDRLYLSINQGTTRWDGAEFRPRPAHELRSRVLWARRRLAPQGLVPSRWHERIHLDARRSHLGPAYELGNVGAIEYLLDDVPDDQVLVHDLAEALVLLDALYRGEDEGIDLPGESPEIADAEGQVASISRTQQRRGQGFRLSAPERRVIETHAVELTARHLEELGYTVLDVGATESFDLDARSAGGSLKVEVKGTTSDGSEILLTRNEVLLHEAAFPHNALAIVHSIQLIRSEMTATGGELVFESPWQLDRGRLVPIAFRYTTKPMLA